MSSKNGGQSILEKASGRRKCVTSTGEEEGLVWLEWVRLEQHHGVGVGVSDN